MRFRVWATLLGAFMLATGAPALAASRNAVTLSKLVKQLPIGKEYLLIQQGLMCGTRDSLKSNGAAQNVSMRDYGPIFAREMSATFNDDADARPNLFEAEAGETMTTAYAVGGLVYDMEIKVCGLAYGDANFGSKGSGFLKIEWQIFSTSTRKVVATIDTTGSFVLKKRDDSGLDALEQITRGAFADSVRQLAASPAYRAIVTAPPPRDETKADPATQTRIALLTAPAKPRPIGDASGAVVLILAGGGHGSGFLVSSDGYLLTNAHVVGPERTVKVRWSDGLETDGQVLRVHEGRDVALIKTDPRGREALALRKQALSVGDSVLAIGAPLETAFQGTVTRGIVSANRVVDGYSFIQSDVTVNPGNSGGPLVDDKGAVVALTVSGYRTANMPTGINFFIPIQDALSFLSLDPK